MSYARHMQAATLDFVIGDTDPLARRTAVLACAAAMVADGHHTECANVFAWALGELEDPNDLREIIIQTHLFAGYPRALSALEAMRKAADKAGVDLGKLPSEASEAELAPAELIERGQTMWDAVYGKNAEKVAQNAGRLSPDLAHWSILHGYGSVLSRMQPDGLTREFCVVSALMLMDAQPQLKGHVQGVLNLGGDADQLWQLFQTVRKLFEANALFDRAKETFEAVLGKKKSDLSFEEEQSMKWL